MLRPLHVLSRVEGMFGFVVGEVPKKGLGGRKRQIWPGLIRNESLPRSQTEIHSCLPHVDRSNFVMGS